MFTDYHSHTFVMAKQQLLDHKYKIEQEHIFTKVKIYTYNHHKREVLLVLCKF